MNSELHSNAHRGNQDDHRDGAQLDANQTHDTKQLHCHHGQNKDLRKGRGKKELQKEPFSNVNK